MSTIEYLDEPIITDFLNITNTSVVTLISITILQTPDIPVIMNNIDKIDSSTLTTKVINFFDNDTELNKPLNIFLIVFLTTLMYKNDIMSKLVCNTLIELGITDITPNELKQNSENLILILTTDKQMGGTIGGGLQNIMKQLFSISFVLFIAYIDYIYINKSIPILNGIYEKYLAYVSLTKSIKGLDVEKQCGYIQIPPLVQYINNYNSEFDIEQIYRVVTCISNGELNTYIRENPTYLSNAVVLYNQDSESSNISPVQFVPDSDFSKQLAILNIEEGGHIDGPISEMINIMNNELMVYNSDGNMNAERTKEKLTYYGDMPHDALVELLSSKSKYNVNYAKSQQNVENGSIFNKINKATSFVKDTASVILSLVQDAQRQVGNIDSISIINSYIWMFQKFCRVKNRELEDYIRNKERNLQDFITDVRQTKENIIQFIKTFSLLLKLNAIAGTILLSFIYELMKKLFRVAEKEKVLEIENDGVAIKDSSLNITTGGKNKRKTSKNKHKYRTRKLKGGKRKRKNTRYRRNRSTRRH